MRIIKFSPIESETNKNCVEWHIEGGGEECGERRRETNVLIDSDFIRRLMSIDRTCYRTRVCWNFILIEKIQISRSDWGQSDRKIDLLFFTAFGKGESFVEERKHYANRKAGSRCYRFPSKLISYKTTWTESKLESSWFSRQGGFCVDEKEELINRRFKRFLTKNAFELPIANKKLVLNFFLKTSAHHLRKDVFWIQK